MILRLITVDNDFGADGDRLLRDAAAEERVRRAAFDHPDLGLAVLDDLDVNPRMRVHPLEADDLALEADRRVRIELGAESVVSEYRAARDNKAGRNQERTKCVSHRHNLLLFLLGAQTLLFIARAAEHVRESVVPFVARVLVD